ncbi:hypothetical protein DSO57_1006978 [Entomophthora muscae]|uniref:Uncharacterized protein n=1 Tax=Entomophthora muscae TaxID=34485 RepID=A0ACC2UHE7_9FUNG|nr:hypothetical protein DSO57_1006978 [Entomophthora muscae]
MIIQLIALIASVAGKPPTFDYIVVGSGPAGSMVAMGLAEKGFKTLLMDAGGDYMSSNITTPAFHVRASEDPNIAWDFFVKHYDPSTKLRQKVLYPRVGGLGGCTLHNAMIHILPNAVDYENMVKLTGDESWSEENMRRYYNKIARPNMAEKMLPMRLMSQLGSSLQSLAGSTNSMMSNKTEAWLKLSTVNIFNLLANDRKLFDLVSQILQRALVSNMLGFDINSYLRSGGLATDSESTFLVPMNVDVQNGGKRTGIYERLKVAVETTPLTIWTNSLVTNVILDNQKRAKGVAFLRGKHLYKAGKRVSRVKGKPGTVYARREVIISGGSFNTPQITMLSGIGDPVHLEKMGIKPLVNLPGVGRNLHDRYEVGVNVRFDNPFYVLGDCTFRYSAATDPCFKQFTERASGPYTFNGILTGTTTKSKESLKTPDLFYLTAPINFWGYHVGMGDEVVDNKDIFSMLVLKARSFNRNGYVRLRSKDPTDVPDINFRYFTQGANKDLPPIIKGIRDLRNILSKFSSGFTEIRPGPNVKTDKQLTDYIIKTAWGHHACGTMKIGRHGDPMAVLDGKFRVRGVKKLRVVDMSIFPDIPGFFPVLYLYMVGAKAADVIAADALA